jgi:hypothetical protein
VTSGVPINFLVERIRNLLGKSSPESAALDPEVVRHLNLVSSLPKPGHLVRAIRGGSLPFPKSLQDSKFSAARRRIGENVRQSLEGQEKQLSLDAGSKQALRSDIDMLNAELRKQIPELPPAEYIEARRFLSDLDNVVKAIDRGELGQEPVQLLLKDGKLSVVGFVQFLGERRMRIGPATAGNETAYVTIFRALASFEASLPAAEK